MVLPRSIWRTMDLKFSNPRDPDPAIRVSEFFDRSAGASMHCAYGHFWEGITILLPIPVDVQNIGSLCFCYISFFLRKKIGLPPTSGSNTRIRLKKRNRVTSKKNPTAVQDVRNSGICGYKPD